MALESALSALGQGIRAPMPTPQPQGGGIPWEQLLKLLPLILAGMKGGMPAVGGYASGLAEGERQNQALGMRQNELAYGREQDEQQRLRQQQQDERQRQQDRLAAVDRSQRQGRQTFEDLRGDAGTATAAAPLDDPNVDPEHWALERTQEAANRLNAGPETVQRVASQVGPAVSQRKKTAALAILNALKGVDPQALEGRTFMDGQSLDQIKAMAGESGAGFGLPQQQKPPDTGSFEDYVIRKHGANPTPEQITQARKEYQQADDRPRITVNTGPTTDLTPGGLDAVALMFLKTGQMPSLGMGAAAVGLRQKIINRAAELMPNLDIAGNQSGFKADQATLTLLTKRVGATRAFAEQAKGSLNNAARASQAMPRTGSPLVNRYSQFVTGKTLTGDPRLTRLEVFIYSAARDYAKVTSGGSESVAALTDAANQKADELLNAAQTPESFQAALTAMQQDMDNAVQTLVAERDLTQQKIRQTPGGGGDEARRGKRAELKRLLGGK